jgi:hypothetical protein
MIKTCVHGIAGGFATLMYRPRFWRSTAADIVGLTMATQKDIKGHDNSVAGTRVIRVYSTVYLLPFNLSIGLCISIFTSPSLSIQIAMYLSVYLSIYTSTSLSTFVSFLLENPTSGTRGLNPCKI